MYGLARPVIPGTVTRALYSPSESTLVSILTGKNNASNASGERLTRRRRNVIHRHRDHKTLTNSQRDDPSRSPPSCPADSQPDSGLPPSCNALPPPSCQPDPSANQNGYPSTNQPVQTRARRTGYSRNRNVHLWFSPCGLTVLRKNSFVRFGCPPAWLGRKSRSATPPARHHLRRRRADRNRVAGQTHPAPPPPDTDARLTSPAPSRGPFRHARGSSRSARHPDRYVQRSYRTASSKTRCRGRPEDQSIRSRHHSPSTPNGLW